MDGETRDARHEVEALITVERIPVLAGSQSKASVFTAR